MNDVSGLEVVWALLLDLNLGSNPELNQPWPTFIGILPDTKPESVALFDNGLPTQGRIQRTGETIGHEGIQIRTTAKNYVAARTRMFSICKELDKVARYEVAVGNDRYLVQAVHRMRQPVYIGQDENDRDSFTVDVSTVARKVT